MRRILVLLGAVLSIAGFVVLAANGLGSPEPSRASASPPAKLGKPSRLDIESGELLSASGMPIHVAHLDALVGGDQKQQTKDGKKAVVTILAGTALLTPKALSQLLNQHLASGSVSDVNVSTQDGSVTITGKSKKGIPLPFRIEGPVTATADGQVKLQVASGSIAHLPKGLSQKLGLDLTKVVPTNDGKGIHAEPDSITFDPDLLWGLPIHGRVTKAEVGKQGLTLTFSNGRP